MFGLVVVGHGNLPKEQLEELERILGDKPEAVAYVSVQSDWTRDQGCIAVNEAIASVRCDEGVVLLTDLAGATPDRCAKNYSRWPDVDVISGLNFALLLSLCCSRKRFSKAQAMRMAIDDAQKNICLLTKPDPKPSLPQSSLHFPDPLAI